MLYLPACVGTAVWGKHVLGLLRGDETLLELPGLRGPWGWPVEAASNALRVARPCQIKAITATDPMILLGE